MAGERCPARVAAGKLLKLAGQAVESPNGDNDRYLANLFLCYATLTDAKRRTPIQTGIGGNRVVLLSECHGGNWKDRGKPPSRGVWLIIAGGRGIGELKPGRVAASSCGGGNGRSARMFRSLRHF